MAKRLWTGEAAKIRGKMRAAADRNVNRKAGDSDLGRALRTGRSAFSPRVENYAAPEMRRAAACADRLGTMADMRHIAAYAAALGVSIEKAAEKVAAHERHLAACGQPFGK